MKPTYSMKALNLYMKKTGRKLNELVNLTGIAHTTLGRYLKEERLPDIDILLKICNTLHLKIDSFLTHPAIETTDVKIYLPEEWDDITFRYDRIEAVRLEKGWTKTEMIERINNCGGTRITRLTYNNLIAGKTFSHEMVLGMIEASGMGLDYFFQQQLPLPAEDSIVVSRRVLQEKDRRIAELEDIVRELELKCKRLEKRVLPRYEERVANLDAEKIIRTFIKQAERNLTELKSWVLKEDEAEE